MALIAIDFDHTIKNSTDPAGPPLPGVREAISTLREHGHRIMIHSCNDPAYIEQWMNNHDIRFDDIWTGKGKPIAALYIDDRAYAFPKDGEWAPGRVSTILGRLAERGDPSGGF